MSSRGNTIKTRSEHLMTLERPMVTQHYLMTWDLDRCVGCQMGPTVCPKEALTHVPGEIIDGRMAVKPSVDVDPDLCVMCGICVETCTVHAISITINDQPENPVLKYNTFPEIRGNLTFDRDAFDFSLKDLVINNCPTHIISYDEDKDTMVVKYEDCIRCRQCEVASKAPFKLPSAGRAVLNCIAKGASKAAWPVQMFVRHEHCILTARVSWCWQIISASNAALVCMPARSNRSLSKKSLPSNLRECL